MFISYTVWYGPWGGHETAPWHFLGGARARRRYAAKHGHEPKNRFGESLFAVTVARRPALGPRQQARRRASHLHPALQPVVVAAGCCASRSLREVVTWNLVIVLRKR